MNTNLLFLLRIFSKRKHSFSGICPGVLEGGGWACLKLRNKKRAQAAGPVQKGIYFKGGQFPLSYTIFISLLLQESYKKVTLLIYILLFNFISSISSST